MNVHTQSITIDSPPDAVFAYVSNPVNLPTWAPAFAPAVVKRSGRWSIRREADEGDIKEVVLELVSSAEFGVIDLHSTNPLGQASVARSRVVGNEQGSEYIFTLFQLPDMPASTFQAQIQGMTAELVTLKGLLEQPA